nr:immunoglobulin light chain junction region [Macaca mulatta]
DYYCNSYAGSDTWVF